MGERIKQLRQSLGLTLEEFGKKIKISAQSVSRIENGINNPSDQTIDLIVTKLGVNEVWLRSGEGNPREKLLWKEEVTLYANRLTSGKCTDLEEMLIRFMAATTPDDWQRLSDVMRGLIDRENGTKKETETDEFRIGLFLVIATLVRTLAWQSVSL